MKVTLKHTTTDGKLRHEVDLINRTHNITTCDELELSRMIKWGTQETLVNQLINKEIELTNSKIETQTRTISECLKYDKLNGIDSLKEKINSNFERIKFLTSFSYGNI